MAASDHPICTACKPPRRHAVKARHIGATKAALAAHRRLQVKDAVARHRSKKKAAQTPSDPR